jgi:hypothetical protein
VARRCLAFFRPAGLQDLEFWNDRILERSSVEELLMLRRLAGFLFLSAALVHAANIEGTVSDAVGGEMLGRVRMGKC